MVRILVATTEGQGTRPGDYAWAVEGELVYVPALVCDDPGCGCARGFAGMASGRSTTTALVVERADLSPNDVSNALSDSLERQGWLSGRWSESDEDLFRELYQRMLMAASHFAPGTVLERDGDYIRRRLQTEPMPAPFGPDGGSLSPPP